MSIVATFDPYYKWLGIPPTEQPPNYYRLLGVNLFESDCEVIASGADQRMNYLRTFQNGPCCAQSQELLNAVAAAKLCLLKRERKSEYDNRLRFRPPARVPSSILVGQMTDFFPIPWPPVIAPPYCIERSGNVNGVLACSWLETLDSAQTSEPRGPRAVVPAKNSAVFH